jgi:glycosyltransferase involved in cell wall biosynthesis/peptidoglycan/xylan/chitin deacetylase (PgdA/CDA1 family)
MDVVLLTTQMSRGGAEVQLARLATTLKRRGWRVGVVSILPDGVYDEVFRAAEIPYFECSRSAPGSRLLLLAAAGRALYQLARWRPAVLITFNYHGDLLGRVCGRLAGIRAIVASLRTAHAKTPLREKLYRRTERLVDVTVSNSQAALAYMIERGVLSPGKTLVIPNGIVAAALAEGESRQAVRAGLQVPQDCFLWVAVGNVLPAKDYPTLLAAAARCLEAGPEFRLLVAGDGAPADLAALRGLAAGLGLERAVQFLGPRTDVPGLLRACDGYVLSSAWEGMPNTVMEAMAAGVPVVSTDAGGARELVRPERDGWIVPCGDPAALAERMRHLMAMPAEARHAMGAAGRERISRDFALEPVVDRWELLLRQLVRATAKPGERPEVIAAPPPARIQVPPPAFVISLDFELMWGVRDKRTIASYGKNILGVRQAVPAMLELFRRYQVKATWASVGMLLFDRKADLLRYLPDQLPSYTRPGLDPFAYLAEVGADERSDPYHFGLSLARQILDCEGMELASHTFSHYYCLEAGQTEAQFRADLEASIAATRRIAERPVSIVFPRNQFNPTYLAACEDLGIKVFRGNETVLTAESMAQGYSRRQRATALLDHYLDLSGDNGFLLRHYPGGGLVNCPSSRFLRPYSERLAFADRLRGRRLRQAMESAARRGLGFHLWWHPHNFGSNLQENLAFLEDLLRHHRDLRERYGVVPMTMGETAAMVP